MYGVKYLCLTIYSVFHVETFNTDNRLLWKAISLLHIAQKKCYVLLMERKH